MQRPSNLPTFGCYGNYSGAYGTHCLRFTMPNGDTFYFSYETLVAFYHPRRGLVVLKNYWGPTTGKHLNAIDENKKNRVDQATFDALYAEAYPQKKKNAA